MISSYLRGLKAPEWSLSSSRPRLRLRWCFTMEEAREERRDLASEKTESSRSPALHLGSEVERKKQEKRKGLSRNQTIPAASLGPIGV